MESLNPKLLEVCSRCGACYHICPACLNLEGYDPRAVIKDILAGTYEKWLNHKSIWQCLECHHCLEICFQHYGFENAMTAMRTLTAKKRMTPVQVKRGWDMFIKTGRLGEPAAPARKKLGLPEAAKSGAEDFKKIVKIYQERKESEARRQKTDGK
ncbi:MAG: hypothetical protein A2X87_06665 [Deltaproteobacteria bacterium GWC2_42_51]|nr:MAG: hypothetical protein A2X87_06665 [Deltaproteobacteria bacterium GWC2_42_51]OGP44306.1 MAG: hypothetical protein A2090_01170 [Deltaproteobacteria bacterium GWD2_42_10]OGP48931.1 MAG: hypothetical protein A2022_01635 [Deltaproteobacteria bacterium GWF2_42_12]OGQ24204.1 MAG: hypothetical protein A3D29_08930 [Deltaproteobacteria bacterium RIFCSPHIGHO2_02_FULL_42_44]OGQ37900.1 MAG: hypothetical protein A3H47_05020 [Deltaproteobacteria bacterium RIFCSPLOWO2_02_FULL_42_39]OGQ64482.1 MAG: hypo